MADFFTLFCGCPFLLANPINLIDPTGEIGLAGAGVGAAADLAMQLWANGGDWGCVSWGQVGMAAALGAIGGGAIGGAFKHAKSGKKWSQLSHKWENAGRRIRKAQETPKDYDLHHWAIERNSRLGKMVPDKIKNHPANLKPVKREVHQRIHGNHPDLPEYDPVRKWWHGTPEWAKSAEVSAASGAAADVALQGGCSC